jgi:hypothetical protein
MALLGICLLIPRLVRFGFLLGILGKGTACTKETAADGNGEMTPGGNIDDLTTKANAGLSL